MARNKHIQGSLENIPQTDVQIMVSSLKELYDLGKPKDDAEVEERIDQYFALCQQSGIRPGVESLSMALHISRITLYRWSNGEDCSQRRAEAIQGAKSVISSFVEQAMLTGRINPASGIFLMKCWLGYKDLISIEETIPDASISKRALPASELPKLGDIKQDLFVVREQNQKN